ncbi:MAG: M20 family metallo-hydrolase [Bacteroidetes bacterium]|nr:M20 family metallo-hydrolase [Bacteroidota bacterium]
MMKELKHTAVELLSELIAIPSFSKEEHGTASLLENFFAKKNIPVQRMKNNIIVRNKFFDEKKPTLLLNSHHDTVRPSASWTKDPFTPMISDGKIYGLGSNDAGGALVSLIATFLHFYSENIPFNLILAATAEEEISGANGIESILPLLGEINLALVGEPTQMKLAIAEKGLLVIDCLAKGKTGHAARNEGENAIYKAMKDLEWFKTFSFPEISPLLGKIHMNVTMINSGTQHNVIPGECSFTVDIRLTETYSAEDILKIIRKNISSEVKPRSLRLRASSIEKNHPFVINALKNSFETFGSPTLSDMALMPFPSVKIGPGDSARSHTADEFIFIEEIEAGIEKYIQLLESYSILKFNNEHSHIRTHS